MGRKLGPPSSVAIFELGLEPRRGASHPGGGPFRSTCLRTKANREGKFVPGWGCINETYSRAYGHLSAHTADEVVKIVCVFVHEPDNDNLVGQQQNVVGSVSLHVGRIDGAVRCVD